MKPQHGLKGGRPQRRGQGPAMLLAAALMWGSAQAQEAPPQVQDVIPQGSAIAPPDAIESSALTGFESIGRPFPLTPNAVRRMLEQGQAQLALMLSEQALNRGSGAPVTALRWRELKARAHMALGQQSQALEVLESLPTDTIDHTPELVLMMAQAQLANGQFQEARGRFSRFLVENPGHPHAYIAQRGIGICELKLGALDRARLQLGLYRERPDRPEPDPEWILAMAELSLAQGGWEMARHGLKQLPEETRRSQPARAIFYRAVRMQVAEAAQTEFTPKLLIDLESALAHNPGETEAQELRILHAKLFHQWATTPIKREKKPTATVQRLMQRRCLLRTLLNAPQGLEQALFLTQLLELEQEAPLGLTAAGGLLTPEGLGLTPLTPPVRAVLAETLLQQQRLAEAVALLGSQRERDGDLIRLQLLAMDTSMSDVTLESLLEELSPSGTNGEPMVLPSPLLEPIAKALLAYTRHGREAQAELLLAQLQTREDDPAVIRLLAYQKGLMLESLGDLEEALLHYAGMSFPAEKIAPAADRLLPESPKEATARLLIQLGKTSEADKLLGKTETPSNSPKGGTPTPAGVVKP
ncbi:Tetratricopeptide TPR_4 [Magnetococcus marinus MC-1]|uniref:Tetratricopeptide TPR_4 n=1 Tax=Magnetococcus marinus (strain ATCC BAA-1437 / JCM 17883 / MC-1) TaxID=156889 RepID=A0L3M4_MAGMM|nr:tetratricopeptide repeat protein [Magnetococcus marinus]ABK42567.1 Tetratricopeptide TPR_4 [Magnetococcus marinus MC-1]